MRELFSCVQNSNSEAKLLDISVALSVPLQRNCNCSLSVQRHFFSCPATENPQTVVFLAELSYIALPGVDLFSLLTSWIMSTPQITVASTQLQVDPACPVVIDYLEPEGCSTASPADPRTDITVIAATATAVGGVLVVVIIIVAIVIAVVRCCRKQSKYR